MFLLSIAGVGMVRRSLRSKSLLHFAQVKTDQSVGEKDCRDASRTSKPVNSRLTDLQHVGELTRGQILGSLISGLFRRIGFGRLWRWFLSFGCHYFFTGSSENDKGTDSDSFTSTIFESSL